MFLREGCTITQTTGLVMITHTADNFGTEFLHQIFSFIMETAQDNTTLMVTLGAPSFIKTWSVFTS